MKNLSYHKKQVRLKRARNTFQQWADARLDEISARVRLASNKRWDVMIDDLDQLHWELDILIRPEDHPPELQLQPWEFCK